MPHGFSTRAGADADDILPGARLVRLDQVHSPDAIVVSGLWDDAARPKADAIVTDREGLALAIVTADCAPVLLVDRDAGIIAAAHAGWRGARAGVIENTVAAMEGLGGRADRIQAAIGPCVAQASYEVDAAMRNEFESQEMRFFEPAREGHWHFNLPGYVAFRLARSGVEKVDDLARDTYEEESVFHSFRRATHRGEATEGRQVSLIGLRITE